MAEIRLPPGWNEERVRKVVEYYENQTEDEELAELEAAWDRTDAAMVQVPNELVPRGACAHRPLRGAEGVVQPVARRRLNWRPGVRPRAASPLPWPAPHLPKGRGGPHAAARPMTRPNAAMAHLLRVLDLRPAGANRFEAVTEQDQGRLFGGLILAQSVVAAGRTVEQGTIHSMHAYFLRAGRPAKPVVYAVERIRDGRNFTGRRVSALQDGTDMIFEASFSFTAPEGGIAYQEPMPAAPDPEGQPSWWETLAPPPEQQRERLHRRWINPIDIRAGELDPRIPLSERLPRRLVWGRPSAPLSEDPILHAAAIAYFSDSGMIATVANVFGMWQPGGATASLDHAIWWHHPPRFDDWLLYTTGSPVARSARALTWGSMYTRDGVRVASVAQEGLFRKPT